MAVLENIRDKAGCLVIIIGLGLMAFLFGDFLNGCASVKRDREMNAFTVNGKNVKIYDYEDRVRSIEEMNRMMDPSGQSRNEAQTHLLRNQIFSSMVAEQVLQEEAEKVGFVVSPAETFDLIQGKHISPVILQNQMFVNPETGFFDKIGLLNFLKQINSKGSNPPEVQAQIDQMRAWWVSTEKSVRDYRLSEKYVSLVASAMGANALEVAHANKADATAADLLYVAQSTSDVPELTVEATKQDLQKYYDKHKESFRTDDAMNVDIIYANIRPSEADFASAKQDIVDAREELLDGQAPAMVLDEYSDASYIDLFLEMSDFNNQYFPEEFLSFLEEANVGDVSGVIEQPANYSVAKLMATKMAPRNVKVRHIVLAPAGSFEGQPDADSLLTALKATPSDFADAASKYSLDQNSAPRGGDLDWLTESAATRYIDAAFSNALFNAEVGVPFAFTSKYGEHLILVEERGETVKKYKVAYANRQVTPSTETETKLYTEMANFLTDNRDGDLGTAAIDAGYQVLNDIHVSSSQPYLAQGIMNSRPLIHWGMKQKAGAISDVTEAEGMYVIMKVNKIIPAGYMPLDAVADQIRPTVENELKLDRMYAELKSQAPTDLMAYAESIDQSVDTLNYVQYSSSRLAEIGYEPAINAVAAFAPLNTLQAVRGLNAIYLTTVQERVDSQPVPTEQDTKLMLEANRRGYVRSQLIPTVIGKAQLKDNRYKFQ
ncbi:MAG: SurA N-terminal domain-containing protein [Porphyromonas sp.]|nr:SurA N-terminal domain-containing protein [Porphyromonas sp.]